MKKAILCTVIAIAAISVTSFFLKSQPEFKSVTVQEFASLIDSGGVSVVDVRTEGEHDKGHIPGTDFNIDVQASSFISQSKLLLPKTTPVALYCRSGNRSKTAAKLLAKEGYQVYELSTGYSGWIDEGGRDAESLVNIDRSYNGLTVYYPDFDYMDLVSGATSPENNHKAIFSCAAAFTDGCGRIIGDYVCGGVTHAGNSGSNGCFVWYNGKWEFTPPSDASKAMERAQEHKGMGFRQMRLIHEGAKIPNGTKGTWVFRALCEKDGVLCIAQSEHSTDISNFINCLHNAGMKYAIYLDMGGWAHSWYRQNEHLGVSYIFQSPHDSYSNWLTFYID